MKEVYQVRIKNNAGYNEQGFIKDVQQMFGLKSQTKARAFYNQFESQGGLRSTDMSKFKDASATKTMAQVAENLTLTLDKTGSAFADKMQAIASSLISGISQFVSAVGKFAALFGDDDD